MSLITHISADETLTPGLQSQEGAKSFRRMIWEDAGAPETAAQAYATGRHVIAYTSQGTTGALDPRAVPERLAEIVRTVSTVGPPARVVIAGGDTSGELLRLLGARSLAIVAAPWGNLPLLRVSGGELDGVEVVLKGGQVGSETAYLEIAEGRSR